MPVNPFNPFDPELIRSVQGLELLAKKAVDNFRMGIHWSFISGEGIEFSQLSHYQPGDDLRKIDWKRFSKSDQLYIRESEVESHLLIHFFIDSSGSMNYRESGLSKIEYAKYLVASIAWLGRSQGDELQLDPLNNQANRDIQHRLPKYNFISFLEELTRIKAESVLPSAHADNFGNKKVKSISIVMTDLWEEDSEWKDWLKHISTSSNETIVFHIQGVKEFDFGFGGHFVFQHLENNSQIFVNTAMNQKSYRKAVSAYIQEWKQWLTTRRIEYQPVFLQQKPGECLQSFLNKRQKLLM